MNIEKISDTVIHYSVRLIDLYDRICIFCYNINNDKIDKFTLTVDYTNKIHLIEFKNMYIEVPEDIYNKIPENKKIKKRIENRNITNEEIKQDMNLDNYILNISVDTKNEIKDKFIKAYNRFNKFKEIYYYSKIWKNINKKYNNKHMNHNILKENGKYKKSISCYFTDHTVLNINTGDELMDKDVKRIKKLINNRIIDEEKCLKKINGILCNDRYDLLYDLDFDTFPYIEHDNKLVINFPNFNFINAIVKYPDNKYYIVNNITLYKNKNDNQWNIWFDIRETEINNETMNKNTELLIKRINILNELKELLISMNIKLN